MRTEDLVRGAISPPSAPDAARPGLGSDVPVWSVYLSTACIALICGVLGFVLVYCKHPALAASRKLPPMFLALASGLVLGIAIFDIMPDATLPLVQEHGWSIRNANLLVLAGGLLVHFIDHVVIEHSHEDHDEESAPGMAEAGTDTHKNCKHESSGLLGERRGDKFTPFGVDGCTGEMLAMTCDPEPLESSLLLVPRLAAWFIHAFFDGVVVAGSDSVQSLVVITLSVALCGIMDVFVLSHQFRKIGASDFATAAAAVYFGLGFPIGALVTLQLSLGNNVALYAVRMVTAGIFVYMATFEIAPPHVHGRWETFQLYVPYVAGALLAYAM